MANIITDDAHRCDNFDCDGDHGVLSHSDLVALASAADLVAAQAKIECLIPDMAVEISGDALVDGPVDKAGTRANMANRIGSLMTGTVRHFVIGPDDFNFIGSDVDIRKAWVRITTTTGFETALPLVLLARMTQVGCVRTLD
jgi:hypothetical protein